MKKLKGLFCLALAPLAFTVVSCGEEEAQAPVEEPIVELEGIDVSSYKDVILVGEEIKLDTKITPANATNQTLNWESSDVNVAKVEDGNVTGVSEGNVTITAKNSDDTILKEVKLKVVKKAKWTIMVYDTGSNGIELETLMHSTNQPEDFNIIVESTLEYSNYTANHTDHNRASISNQKYVIEEELKDTSMGTISSLKNFMEWGMINYPAEKVGVFLIGPGAAMRGGCFDYMHQDDRITNSEFNQAFQAAFKDLRYDSKLEFVGYDSDMLAVQDVAEFHSHYFNYFVSSQDEGALSWNLEDCVEDLYSGKSTKEALTTLVQTANGYNTDYFTISALDLSYMEEYKNAWENMAQALSNKFDSSYKSDFRDLVNTCTHYGSDAYYEPFACAPSELYGAYDAKQFLNALANSSTFNPGETYTKPVLDAFDKLVFANYTGAAYATSNGLNMFYSASSRCDKNMYYTKSHTNFAVWSALNRVLGY